MLKKAKWICSRLSQRPDSEHVQNLIRFLIASLFIIYLSVCWHGETDLNISRIIWLVLLSDLGVSLALMLAIVMHPQISHVRRCIGIIADYTSLTVLMLLMGEAGSPLYVLCLWVTIGNGLRYGSAYLLVTTTLGALRFPDGDPRFSVLEVESVSCLGITNWSDCHPFVFSVTT